MEISKEKILFVEGKDDSSFFNKFISHLGLNNIQVVSCEGKDKFPMLLKTIKNVPNFNIVTSLGIVRDADESVSNAFKSLQSALSDAGFVKPSSMAEFVVGAPNVGIFILPDCDRMGELED